MTKLAPVAWRHTLHMEGGQTTARLSADDDNPFGEPGRDYSATYAVTSEPLYALTAAPATGAERAAADRLMTAAQNGKISGQDLQTIFDSRWVYVTTASPATVDSKPWLLDSIDALLAMDADGSLVPHGIGGHARTLLTEAAKEIIAHRLKGGEITGSAAPSLILRPRHP
ncbi:MAG TPA: hypothetical protein VGI79_19030 [Caulobacteraceae bacterium]|jgi:hypothetical protein